MSIVSWYERLTYKPNSSLLTDEKIEKDRQEYYKALDEMDRVLAENPSLTDPKTRNFNFYTAEPFHFLLSYQRRNNRDLFSRIAQSYRRMFPEVCYVHPNLPTIENPRRRNKIRVGFISGRMSKLSSVMKDRMGVIKNLDRSRFHVILVSFRDPVDDFGQMTARVADQTFVCKDESFEITKNFISQLNLDVAVYCELSFGPWTYPLSHCRLAPVQLTTWGHSDTSGVPTIDYYISSSLYEPEDVREAQSHYSEKLICHDDLCTHYFRPYDDGISKDFLGRERFFIPEEATLYLLIQTPFKVTNDFIKVIANILKRDSSAYLMMSSHPTDESMGRNNYTTLHNELKFDEICRVRVLPWLKYLETQNLLKLGDVLLDAYPFGGCNTSIESLHVGKPIVTLPTRFLSGRFTLGFYKKMGILDLVATDFDDYVDKAVRLGKDKAFRKEISHRIEVASQSLFESKESVESWNETLEKLASPFVKKISYTEILQEAVKKFHQQIKRLRTNIFPFNSSLLCMLRDKTFKDSESVSPHFAILETDEKRLANIFTAALRQNGFSIQSIFQNDSGSYKVYMIAYDTVVLRVSVLYKKQSSLVSGIWYKNRLVLSTYPLVKSWSKKNWFGLSWTVPSNSFDFLKYRYGPLWKSPWQGEWHGIRSAFNIRYPVVFCYYPMIDRPDAKRYNAKLLFKQAAEIGENVVLFVDAHGYKGEISHTHPAIKTINNEVSSVLPKGSSPLSVSICFHPSQMQSLISNQSMARKRALVLFSPSSRFNPNFFTLDIFDKEAVF